MNFKAVCLCKLFDSGKSKINPLSNLNHLIYLYATPDNSLNCSWVRPWCFRSSFNLAISNLPVVDFGTSPVYLWQCGQNTQRLMVFFPFQTSSCLLAFPRHTQAFLKFWMLDILRTNHKAVDSNGNKYEILRNTWREPANGAIRH